MAELEKVIKGLGIVSRMLNEMGRWNEMDIVDDALELLKEQEDLGTELGNAVELIHKKNERIEKLLKERETQKFFVDESGKVTPLPVVVRCKECKHGEKANDVYLCGKPRGFGLAHEPNWFCADGERR